MPPKFIFRLLLSATEFLLLTFTIFHHRHRNSNSSKSILTSTSTSTNNKNKMTQLPADYNPMPHVIPEGENATPLEVVGATASDKLVIILVGLPGTGKTHMAKRICRYISFFLDIPAQIFNVGDYRRKICGAKLPASFYDPENLEGMEQRSKACDAALEDLIEFMGKDGVRLAVYDSTNSSPDRRHHIKQKLNDSGIGFKKMFIETLCDDEEVLEENIKSVKMSTPDYEGMDPEDAVNDFKERRKNYMSVYKTLEDDEGSFIKVFNSKKFVIHNIRGYLPLKVVHFVMNLHTLPRTFYLTRHGQSEYNLLGKIGGDSGLSKNGQEYARRLAKFAEEVIAVQTTTDQNGNEIKTKRPARLWTSTLRRTKETSAYITHEEIEETWDNGDSHKWKQFRPNPLRNLDELYAGNCDGMTYKEIEKMYPDEFAARQDDKLSYRYPRGESYMDVTLRLEPLAHRMEATREPLLVIGHQGILRIIYAYFMGMSRAEAPYVSIPLNHIIVLKPHAYGCDEEHICLMPKHEMVSDGQDEPVTSMPVKKSHKEGDTKNDPVLNAPSC